MNQHERLLQTVLRGRSDVNIRLSDLRALMAYRGFEEGVGDRHHLFDRGDVVNMVGIVNPQGRGDHGKPYQGRQVGQLILRYRLEGDD